MLPLGPLYQFRHGDHICVFYRSDDGLLELLTPYIAEGLRKGERCFCVQQPHIAKRIQDDLRFIGMDVDSLIASGAIEFHTIRQVYFPGGAFDPHRMLTLLEQSIRQAAASGFTGFRTAGELSWANGYCDEVVEYEGMVQQHFPGRPVTGLCQYPVASFSSEFLNRILAHHRQHILEPEVRSSNATLQIDDGDFTTQIVAKKLLVNPRYDYVVARRARRDVIGWGHSNTLENARQKSEELVRSCS
jgi:hypothetical protein